MSKLKNETLIIELRDTAIDILVKHANKKWKYNSFKDFDIVVELSNEIEKRRLQLDEKLQHRLYETMETILWHYPRHIKIDDEKLNAATKLSPHISELTTQYKHKFIQK